MLQTIRAYERGQFDRAISVRRDRIDDLQSRLDDVTLRLEELAGREQELLDLRTELGGGLLDAKRRVDEEWTEARRIFDAIAAQADLEAEQILSLARDRVAAMRSVNGEMRLSSTIIDATGGSSLGDLAMAQGRRANGTDPSIRSVAI